MPSIDEVMLPTVEVAALLHEYLERGTDTKSALARRAQVPHRTFRRIMAMETTSTTSDVAGRLLEAAGLDLSDVPSYFDEGWGEQERKKWAERLGQARSRQAPWSHGTLYGYDKKRCRCRECSGAMRRKNALNWRRRSARQATASTGAGS